MKKVLSFVLVLCMVLSSLTFAFADTTTASLKDVAGNDNEAAINVVNGLGIVTGYTDGTFKPENAVTRAEFAAMITRALDIPESALAGLTNTSFKDTAGYGWAVKYLAFCESKGIMLGDGNGNAMPGRTITVNEAMTMVLRALGLTNNSALLVGSWPANYVTVAKNEGLYDDVKAVSTVDRASAAQVIYNALTVQLFTVNADGDTGRVWKNNDEVTLMGNLVDDDQTTTNAVIGWTDATVIELADFIGAYGDIYRNDDGDIIAVDVASTFMTGDLNNAGDTFTVDGVDYNFTATTAAIVTNGSVALAQDITPYYGQEDITMAVKVVGKTIDAVYSVVVWAATDDKQIDDLEELTDELADDDAILGIKFATNKSNEKIGYTLAGVDSLDKIAEDNVVYVYAFNNQTANKVVKIEVGTATVEGKVTRIVDADTVVLAGAEYDVCAAAGAINAGDEGTAYLDFDGCIYAFEKTDETVGNYAIAITAGAVTGAYSFDDNDKAVKMFTATGDEKIVKDASKNAVESAKITKGTVDTPAAVGQIFKYALNKDGELKTVTVVTNSALSGAAVSDSGKLIGGTKVASNVVVLVLEADSTDYSIGKVSDLKDVITGTAVLNDDGEIAVIAVVDTMTGNTDDVFGIIVSNEGKELDADDNDLYITKVMIDGAAAKEITSDMALTKSAIGATALQVITIDSEGKVTAIDDITTKGYDAAVGAGATCSAVDGTILTVNGTNYEVADDAVVYVYDGSAKTDAEKWSVGKLSKAKKNGVYLVDTDKTGDDGYGVYDVVIVNVF